MNGVELHVHRPPWPIRPACTPPNSTVSRASWVVRPDGTATGVQFSGFPQDRDHNIDPFNLDGLTDFQVRNDVRNKRHLGPAGPIEFPQPGKPQSSINGVPVTPTLVTGTFRLG